MDEKILKADSLPEKMLVPSPKVLKREVYEASRDARDVVSLAQERAKQIIEQAERERDAIREQARQEGNTQGLAEWNRILLKATQRSEELAKEWEESMLRLSVRVAEKIVGEVLKNVRSGKHLSIQVNQAEAQQVRARVDRLRDALGSSSEIEIIASNSVPPGGCVIESELGIIDARLETQLKCLEDVLVRGVAAD